MVVIVCELAARGASVRSVGHNKHWNESKPPPGRELWAFMLKEELEVETVVLW